MTRPRAACNGADHTHRVYQAWPPRTYTERWNFLKTSSTDPTHYRNLYRNTWTGRTYWSPPCSNHGYSGS